MLVKSINIRVVGDDEDCAIRKRDGNILNHSSGADLEFFRLFPTQEQTFPTSEKINVISNLMDSNS